MWLAHHAVRGAFCAAGDVRPHARIAQQCASSRHLDATADGKREQIGLAFDRVQAIEIQRDDVIVRQLRMRPRRDDRPAKPREVLDTLNHPSPRSALRLR